MKFRGCPAEIVPAALRPTYGIIGEPEQTAAGKKAEIYQFKFFRRAVAFVRQNQEAH
tara:strand:+ start:518 stop:688 length:171 start_codon:yes stop_codon:yes gene_type:complete